MNFLVNERSCFPKEGEYLVGCHPAQCKQEINNSTGSYWNVSCGFNNGTGNVQNDTKGFILWYSFLVGSVRNANGKIRL